MSFDVFVQDLPPSARSVAEIPGDFQPQPLGKRSLIIEAIKHVVPSANFSDPTWGTIDGKGYSIEINMGAADPVRSFAFHLRGGQEALFVVAEILAELRLRALAPGTESGFFDLGELQPAYARWKAYRNQMVNGDSTQ
jgi:hypothetical protein